MRSHDDVLWPIRMRYSKGSHRRTRLPETLTTLIVTALPQSVHPKVVGNELPADDDDERSRSQSIKVKVYFISYKMSYLMLSYLVWLSSMPMDKISPELPVTNQIDGIRNLVLFFSDSPSYPQMLLLARGKDANTTRFLLGSIVPNDASAFGFGKIPFSGIFPTTQHNTTQQNQTRQRKGKDRRDSQSQKGLTKDDILFYFRLQSTPSRRHQRHPGVFYFPCWRWCSCCS